MSVSPGCSVASAAHAGRRRHCSLDRPTRPCARLMAAGHDPTTWGGCPGTEPEVHRMPSPPGEVAPQVTSLPKIVGVTFHGGEPVSRLGGRRLSVDHCDWSHQDDQGVASGTCSSVPALRRVGGQRLIRRRLVCLSRSNSPIPKYRDTGFVLVLCRRHHGFGLPGLIGCWSHRSLE